MGNTSLRPFSTGGSLLEFFNIKTPVLRYNLVHPLARRPQKSSEFSAGFDIASVDHVCVPPWEQRLIDTGIEFRAPEGCFLKISPRSGFSLHTNTSVMAGIFDLDYTSSLSILIYNHSNEEIMIVPGDRIAQIIPVRIKFPLLKEVSNLPTTRRGTNGFGSSGLA